VKWIFYQDKFNKKNLTKTYGKTTKCIMKFSVSFYFPSKFHFPSIFFFKNKSSTYYRSSYLCINEERFNSFANGVDSFKKVSSLSTLKKYTKIELINLWNYLTTELSKFVTNILAILKLIFQIKVWQLFKNVTKHFNVR